MANFTPGNQHYSPPVVHVRCVMLHYSKVFLYTANPTRLKRCVSQSMPLVPTKGLFNYVILCVHILAAMLFIGGIDVKIFFHHEKQINFCIMFCQSVLASGFEQHCRLDSLWFV